MHGLDCFSKIEEMYKGSTDGDKRCDLVLDRSASLDKRKAHKGLKL